MFLFSVLSYWIVPYIYIYAQFSAIISLYFVMKRHTLYKLSSFIFSGILISAIPIVVNHSSVKKNASNVASSFIPPKNGVAGILTYNWDEKAQGWVVTGCTNLNSCTYIDVPDTYTDPDNTHINAPVIKLGNGCFDQFGHHDTVIDIINIGANVNEIETWAFLKSKALNISFSSNSKLSKIDTQAFKSLSYIRDIEIPNSITYIGNASFSNSTKLKYLKLPNKNFTFTNDEAGGTVAYTFDSIAAKSISWPNENTNFSYEKNRSLNWFGCFNTIQNFITNYKTLEEVNKVPLFGQTYHGRCLLGSNEHGTLNVYYQNQTVKEAVQRLCNHYFSQNGGAQNIQYYSNINYILFNNYSDLSFDTNIPNIGQESYNYSQTTKNLMNTIKLDGIPINENDKWRVTFDLVDGNNRYILPDDSVNDLNLTFNSSTGQLTTKPRTLYNLTGLKIKATLMFTGENNNDKIVKYTNPFNIIVSDRNSLNVATNVPNVTNASFGSNNSYTSPSLKNNLTFNTSEPVPSSDNLTFKLLNASGTETTWPEGITWSNTNDGSFIVNRRVPITLMGYKIKVIDNSANDIYGITNAFNINTYKYTTIHFDNNFNPFSNLPWNAYLTGYTTPSIRNNVYYDNNTDYRPDSSSNLQFRLIQNGVDRTTNLPQGITSFNQTTGQITIARKINIDLSDINFKVVDSGNNNIETTTSNNFHLRVNPITSLTINNISSIIPANIDKRIFGTTETTKTYGALTNNVVYTEATSHRPTSMNFSLVDANGSPLNTNDAISINTFTGEVTFTKNKRFVGSMYIKVIDTSNPGITGRTSTPINVTLYEHTDLTLKEHDPVKNLTQNAYINGFTSINLKEQTRYENDIVPEDTDWGSNKLHFVLLQNDSEIDPSHYPEGFSFNTGTGQITLAAHKAYNLTGLKIRLVDDYNGGAADGLYATTNVFSVSVNKYDGIDFNSNGNNKITTNFTTSNFGNSNSATITGPFVNGDFNYRLDGQQTSTVVGNNDQLSYEIYKDGNHWTLPTGLEFNTTNGQLTIHKCYNLNFSHIQIKVINNTYNVSKLSQEISITTTEHTQLHWNNVPLYTIDERLIYGGSSQYTTNSLIGNNKIVFENNNTVNSGDVTFSLLDANNEPVNLTTSGLGFDTTTGAITFLNKQSAYNLTGLKVKATYNQDSNITAISNSFDLVVHKYTSMKFKGISFPTNLNWIDTFGTTKADRWTSNWNLRDHLYFNDDSKVQNVDSDISFQLWDQNNQNISANPGQGVEFSTTTGDITINKREAQIKFNNLKVVAINSFYSDASYAFSNEINVLINPHGDLSIISGKQPTSINQDEYLTKDMSTSSFTDGSHLIYQDGDKVDPDEYPNISFELYMDGKFISNYDDIHINFHQDSGVIDLKANTKYNLKNLQLKIFDSITGTYLWTETFDIVIHPQNDPVPPSNGLLAPILGGIFGSIILLGIITYLAYRYYIKRKKHIHYQEKK